MGSEGFHEAAEALSPRTRDLHRAIVSLMEELDAIDWYQQRVEATSDTALREILEHNRDEEKEHAAMVLEWLRRHDARFEQYLRKYLFTDRPIVAIEDEPDNGAGGHTAPTVGSLRRR